VAHIRLPAILAREAGGRSRWETDAPTIAAALRELPIADLLFAGDELRPLVNVYVDGEDARAALDAPLAPHSTVVVIAAVAGGR
jgi:molybdopterin converting factor small subunit